ncbi:MAG: YHYH protein [Microthrixaceae bacterium]|nr:YHYH protein [Microthrixaceae bacterium]
MRRRNAVTVLGGLVTVALLAGPGAGASPADGAAAVDLTNLPIGTEVTTAPQAGAVYSCQTTFNGGGAFAYGDWIHDDGTYDVTAKPHVDGSVSWTPDFSTSFGQTGATRGVDTNGLPDHPTGVFPISPLDDAYQFDRNPNSIGVANDHMALGSRPGLRTTPTCLGLGRIGLLTTGAAVFNGLDAEGRDAVAYEIQDACDGHPEANGKYHYHSIPSCIDDPATGGHSPLLGYANDGFGIYGHYGEDGEVLTNADLDECHGHVHQIEWDGVPRVMYHYHGTYEYPYTVGCLRGDFMASTPVDCDLAPPDNDFTDVDPGTDTAFLDAADWVDCRGLLTDTALRPTSTLNRKYAVLLLWRFLGEPEATTTTTYTDVPADAPYHEALDWAVENGVYTIGSDTAFKPTKAVKRTQFLVMLWSLLDRPADDPDTSFTDVSPTAWYHDALDWAVAHGLFRAYADGSVHPSSTMKRKHSIMWLSGLAADADAWADHAGTPPDALRVL